jgi:hypothetical protein
VVLSLGQYSVKKPPVQHLGEAVVESAAQPPSLRKESEAPDLEPRFSQPAAGVIQLEVLVGLVAGPEPAEEAVWPHHLQDSEKVVVDSDQQTPVHSAHWEQECDEESSPQAVEAFQGVPLDEFEEEKVLMGEQNPVFQQMMLPPLFQEVETGF